MRIAAVFSQFPCYDETFLLRELLGLRAGGIDLDILSMKPCRDSIVHDQAKPFLPQTQYCAWFCSVEILSACLYWLLRKPRVIGKHFFFFLSGLFRSPAETLKNLILLPQALTFARRLSKQKPALVHGFWATYATSSAGVIADLLAVPLTMSAHAHDIYQPNALLVEKLERARIVLTCTKANEVYLKKIAPRAAAQIVALHHGLDTKHFCPCPPTAKNPRNAPLRILSVGSIIPRKGYPLLLRAFRRLLDTGHDATLTIVGDGYERPLSEDWIKRLDLAGKVTLAGYVTEKNMPPFYQAADLFILTAIPSIHFGLPNVVIEAMACGLPVVVTGLPSVTDTLADAEVGIFLPPESEAVIEDAAVAALQKLATDLAARRRLGENGREFCKREFDMDQQGKEICRLLRAVVDDDKKT